MNAETGRGRLETVDGSPGGRMREDVRRALGLFNDSEEKLSEFYRRKHEGGEMLDLEVLSQMVLDAHEEIRLLKNVLVRCCGIGDLDSPRPKYLDKFYLDEMSR